MNEVIAEFEAGSMPSFEVCRDGLGDVVPLLHRLQTTEQDADWHAEGDVAVHTAMVMDAVASTADWASLPVSDRTALGLAALFHDIAKPLTTRTREIDGRLRVVAPGHARVGASWLLPRLLAVGLDWAMVRRVVALVRHHHDLWGVARAALTHDRAAASAAAGVVAQVDGDLLLRLARGDVAGRLCDDRARLESRLDAAELALGLAQTLPDRSAMRAAIEESTGASREDHLATLASARAHRALLSGAISTVEEAVASTWALRERSTPCLTLTVGCSGSGKSTWCAGAPSLSSSEVVSMDTLRVSLTGQRHDQRSNRAVLAAARDAVRDALRRRVDVVLDATSLRRDGRGWFAALARDYDAAFRLVCFPRPWAVLAETNGSRSHRVPSEVLRRQFDTTEWPAGDECDEVEWSL